MSGAEARSGLEVLARDWPAPEHGRYVPQPARANDDGIAYLPPPAPDPLPKIAIGVGSAAVVASAAVVVLRIRQHGRPQNIAKEAAVIQSEVA